MLVVFLPLPPPTMRETGPKARTGARAARWTPRPPRRIAALAPAHATKPAKRNQARQRPTTAEAARRARRGATPLPPPRSHKPEDAGIPATARAGAGAEAHWAVAGAPARHQDANPANPANGTPRGTAPGRDGQRPRGRAQAGAYCADPGPCGRGAEPSPFSPPLKSVFFPLLSRACAHQGKKNKPIIREPEQGKRGAGAAARRRARGGKGAGARQTQRCWAGRCLLRQALASPRYVDAVGVVSKGGGRGEGALGRSRGPRRCFAGREGGRYSSSAARLAHRCAPSQRRNICRPGRHRSATRPRRSALVDVESQGDCYRCLTIPLHLP